MKQKFKSFLLPFGGSWSIEIFCGLTIALALVPEAIAFALVAGLDAPTAPILIEEFPAWFKAG